MENKKQRRLSAGIILLTIFTAGILFAAYTDTIAADRNRAQGLVDKARVTFKEFMGDPNYTWLHENVDRAKGVLIFPQVIKGGFI